MDRNLKKSFALLLSIVMMLGIVLVGVLFETPANAQSVVYSDWSSWSTTAVSATDSREVQTKTVSEYWRTRYDYDYYCTWHGGASAADAYEYSNTGGNWHFYVHDSSNPNDWWYYSVYSYTKNVQAYPTGYYRDVAPGYILSYYNGELPGNDVDYNGMKYCKNAGNKTGYALRADQSGQEQGRNQIVFLVGSQDEYHDVVYYRYRTITKTYTVRFDANGGNGAPSSQTKIHGKSLTLSSTKPTRTGYNFNHWDAWPNGGGASYSPGGQFSYDGDSTLYAIWEPHTYTVSYDANGGTGAPSSQTKTYGVDLKLSNYIPTRTGYDFLGWSKSSTATTATYPYAGTYTDNAGATLYAVWKVKSYTLTYILSNEVYQTTSYDFGASVNPAPTPPERENMTFAGWTTATPKTMPAYNVTIRGGYGLQFGSYPQSEVTDEQTLELLNSRVSDGDWISYNYYSGTGAYGSMVDSDYMEYVDLDIDGNGRNDYRGVIIHEFRPERTHYNTSTYNDQERQGYTDLEKVYWFSYEPLYWTVIDAETGLCVCDTIIDSQPFNNTMSEDPVYDVDGTYVSDYKYSDIRVWLNNDFRNTAFTSVEKTFIRLSEVDNPRSMSVNYTPDKFTDYIFLLSKNQIGSAPAASASEYCGSQGYKYITTRYSYDNSIANYSPNYCLTRTSSTQSILGTMTDSVCVGTGSDKAIAYSVGYGIRPAINLNLSVLDSTVAYTLTYRLNGRVYAQETYRAGEVIVPVDEPEVPEGLYFSGWQPEVPYVMPIGDLTINGSIGMPFGSYPQSQVTDVDLLAELNNRVQEDDWVSYNYYSGTGEAETAVSSDYMEYADIDIDNDGDNDYRGVILHQYRPNLTYSECNPENSTQYTNNYELGKVYWYKYDPLYWMVIDEELDENDEKTGNSVLMCTSIIDSQPFINITGNDEFASSDVRTWLNNDFYSIAFTATEKVKIVNEDENYVRLLSSDEAYKNNVWNTDDNEAEFCNNARMASRTSYAEIQGLDKNVYALMDKTEINMSLFSIYIHTVEENGRFGIYGNSLINYYLNNATAIEGIDINNFYKLEKNYDINATDVGVRPVLIINNKTASPHTITFVPNNGEDNIVVTANYGTSITAPSDPKMLGHTFVGWDKAVPATMPDEDMVITALWAANEYTVTYLLDGEEYYSAQHESAVDNVVYGSDIPIREKALKEGYTVTDWDFTPELESGKMPACDVIAESYSYINTYTVTWNYDGESYIEDYEFGAEITEFIPLDKEGYTFSGWSPDVPETMPAQNLEFTAQYSVNSYTITYNVDGDFYNQKTYEYNADITKLETPVKYGYVFSGWNGTEPEKMPAYDIVLEGAFYPAPAEYTVELYLMNMNGEYDLTAEKYTGTTGKTVTTGYTIPEGFTLNSEKSVLEGEVVADGSLVLKVYLDRNIHTISFDDGTNITSDELYYGDEIVKPADPEKEGYTFKGWSEDGENVVEVEETVPDRDIEYIAVWSVKQFAITFKYGEVNDNAVYKTVTEDFGTAIEEVVNPEFEGYTFLNWNADIPETMPAHDTTITALWSINEYKVTYKLDGVEYYATPYESAIDTFTYGSEVTVRPNAVKEGYTVSGWVFTPDLEDGKMPASDVIANATSSANKYTLTVNYVMNDGSDAPEAHTEQVTYGEGYSVETPAVTGYTPDTELVEGTMDSTEGKTVTVTYDINSYDVNITYEISDDKADAPEAYSQTVEYGMDYSVESPDVPGYTPDVAVVEGKMGTEPINVTVIYTPNAHTVTWNVDGEKTVDNVVYGDDIVKPSNPEKEGYEFLGWSEDGETVVEVEETVPDRDIEYIAVWSINSYKITYNVDGVFYDEKTYEYNADVAKLGELTKQGYVFSGWDKEEPAKMPAENLVLNGSFTAATNTGYTVETYVMNLEGEYDKTSETFIGTTGETATAEYTVPEGFTLNAEKSELEGVIAPDESLTLKVYLDRNRHNISFNDGTDITSDELYYGADIVKPDDPKKEGYEFLGWSEDGETVVEVEETVPDRDIEYIAVWSVKQYTITFKYGEVNDNAEYKTITKEFGEEIEEIADLEFTGYTFLGWDSQIPATMPAENITITALWAVNEYKVTYKLDGVEYFATPYESAVDIFTYGSEVTVRPKAEKEGYTVSDWVFTPELVDGKMPAGDVVANATSSVNTYTLTFTYGDVNAGAVFKEINAEYGSPVTASENPEFSGFIFREWDAEIPATMPAEDRTINALWDNGVFTITYKLDGEEYPSAENAVDTYFYGETVTVREKAEKEGHTVSDWSFAPALENGKMPAGNVIANATSAVNEYTVTWIVNGSSTVDSYAFGAEIVKPADPEMSGKVFKGWSGEIPATMPARNLVFVASFDAITHTATFVVPDENGSYTDETGTYEVVKTVIFEEGQTTIAEPAVPERDGYVGEWEDYTIGTEDIVIKAIYTIKDSTNTDELITEKTADEKDGGVITINLNAYSKAKTIKTDEKSQPLDVVIIVDQSGSMTDKLRGGETKQKELQNQAKALVASLNSNANATGANHRVAVVGFSMGGKAAGGFSAYQNTEILTVPGGAVNYKDATDSNYKNALMSVKNSYTDITNAISRTKAGGATSADLGFDMAAKIFANSATQAGEPEHKKIIIFITDGVPTTATEFDTGVANCAITRAKYLKAQDVTIYTVAISDEADPNNTTRDYNKFLHATSSNYKAASSVNTLGEGRNEGYFLTVRDSAELQQKLENISIRINPATAGFYAVTLYDTVTKEFTMTVPQETAFRENVIEKYGISNADITVDRKADGTTYVEVRNITPYAYYDSTNVMQGYKADITFDVTANENAVDAGEYPANTDEAGVVLDGYTVGTFEPQSVTVTEDRCIVEFIIGNDTYEIREVNIGDSITAPECSYAAWNIPAGTTASNRVEKFFADYGEADRTVTWHIGEDTITQHYATGQIIVVPEIDADLVIAGWSPAVEVCVGYTDLEYTALFSEHTHHYERVSGSGICTEGRAITYKCSVCNAKYTEELPACEHELESVAYKTNDATLVHIFCKNCLYSEKANTLSFSMTYQRSDYFDGTVADLHINNPGNKAYDIRIPLSSLSDKCQANPRKIKIIHYKSDGRTENCSYVIDGDYIVLRCTSFSYYVFTTDEIDESINSNTIDCILNGHQFKYVYNNDATAAKDGTETEVCEHCGATGETRTADGTKLNSEYKLPTSFKTQTAAYKTYVTVSVTLKDIPAGAKVYINGKEATASGNTYSADIGQVTATKEVKLEVKQGSTVLDSTTLKIEVNSSFFGKLISFFVNFLFNLFKWKKVTVNF